MMDQFAQQRLAKLNEVMRRLPNEYQNRQRLQQDLTGLLSTYQSLSPDTNTFSGQGRTVTLFYLSGVIPISYSGSTYNIPVTIYFDPPYPNQPPRCFVTPSAGMALKPNHPNVDNGGMVYLPYLSSWNSRSSSLTELVQTIASAFSAAPPVHSTASAQPPRPAAQATPAGYPVAKATPLVSHAQPAGQLQPPLSEKQRAVQALTAEAKSRWPNVVGEVVDDLNAQLNKKFELEGHAEKVEAEINLLKEAVDANTTKEQELCAIETELQAFVLEHVGKEPDPDSLAEDLDSNSKLVLETLSEELALEEYRLALDLLLETHKISMEDFLKEVRDASREQFKLKYSRQKAAEAVQTAAAARPVAAQAVPA
jgi:ESCRT-I complex subunit TSG101